jgi:hypothetical protein
MDQHSPWWVSVSALVGAGAALALPGPTGPATAIASVLVLGALALLAGHTWGLLVVATANVLLVGHVWPVLAFSGGSAFGTAAAATALLSALPGLTFLGVAMPALVDVVLDSPSERVRSAGVAMCHVGAVLALVLPAL